MIACSVIQPILTEIKNTRKRSSLEDINEAISLVQAVGSLTLVNHCEMSVKKVYPGTFFSKTNLQKIKLTILEDMTKVLFINFNISPVQQRDIENFLKIKVVDRTGLILEIFSTRAKSFEGRLQVDLARLSYEKSRLVRTWTHLERQRGGRGFISGPGETQIESDRRQLNNSIKRIKLKLKRVEKTRVLHRESRVSLNFPMVALVGYTNVGKTTLFNKLTGSVNLQKDMLFATLDATARRIDLPSSKPIIISDTVGFISNLPTQLIQSFKSTLDELTYADLILHIMDVSSPSIIEERLEVNSVLKDLGIDFNKTKVLEIGNKSDLTPDRNVLQEVDTLHATISAKNQSDFREILRLIDVNLTETLTKEALTLKFCEGRKRAWLLEKKLVQKQRYLPEGIELHVRWTSKQKDEFLSIN